MLLSVAAPMFAGAHARRARSEQEHLYALTTDWAVKAALPLVAFLFFFARPTLSLFGAQFAVAGAAPLQVLLAAQLFNLASGPNGNMAVMSGLEREAFRIDLVTMGGTAILLLMLVPMFGLLGVALCVLANSIANNSWTLLLVRTKLEIRWWNRRYLSWTLPAIAAGGVGVLLSTLVASWNVVGLALALAGMYASFVAVSLLQGLHDDDRELISLVRTRLAFR
jgi:O-antigen/teichoic acid export membrane protein